MNDGISPMISGTGQAHGLSPHLLNTSSFILFIPLFPKRLIYNFLKNRKRSPTIHLIEMMSPGIFTSFYGPIWQLKTVPGEWKGLDGEEPGDQHLAGWYPCSSAPVNLSFMMLLVFAAKNVAKILILWWLKTSEAPPYSEYELKIPWHEIDESP